MGELHSYGKIYNFGHRAIVNLLKGPVVVEEKVDGSQFSFGIRNGQIHCRSKGVAINVDAPDSMFAKAVAVVRELAPMLHDGWTYRGEYLQKPKHNALAYDRIPYRHIILFDVDTIDEMAEDWRRPGVMPGTLEDPIVSKLHKLRQRTEIPI